MVVALVGLATQIADVRRGIAEILAVYQYEENADEYMEHLYDSAVNAQAVVVNDTGTVEEIAQEEYKSEQQKAFDERIALIKDELGSQQVPHTPRTVADILHPDVENLPHDSIIDYETNPPDVEYSN